MVDDYRLRASLRLRSLARVVDDERVKMRQRCKGRFGEAFRRQCQCLSRQPFEGAMLAEMNDRIGTKIICKPGIGGEIAVRRHQRRIVIGGFRVDVVAARRLDQHCDIAGAKTGNGKAAAIEPARTEKRVAFRRTPAVAYSFLYGWRQ